MSQPRIGDNQFGLAALTPEELARLASAEAGRIVPVAGVSVTPIDYNWGSPATAGLWRVDVRQLRDDTVSFASYFVKLLRHPRLWPALSMLPDDASRQSFVEYFPWRFELDMYESGIADALPPGFRRPAVHTVKHIDADHIALWLEYIELQPGRWNLADYQQAAYLLGRLAARRRHGAVINARLPAICRTGLPGESLCFYVRSRLMQGTVPALRDPVFWRHPLITAALRQVGDPTLPEDMHALADRLPEILDLLADLPQTHAHGDASPQNLLRPAHEPGTLVVIDWGFATCCQSASTSASSWSGSHTRAKPTPMSSLRSTRRFCPVIWTGWPKRATTSTPGWCGRAISAGRRCAQLCARSPSSS